MNTGNAKRNAIPEIQMATVAMTGHARNTRSILAPVTIEINQPINPSAGVTQLQRLTGV